MRHYYYIFFLGILLFFASLLYMENRWIVRGGLLLMWFQNPFELARELFIRISDDVMTLIFGSFTMLHACLAISGANICITEKKYDVKPLLDLAVGVFCLSAMIFINSCVTPILEHRLYNIFFGNYQ